MKVVLLFVLNAIINRYNTVPSLRRTGDSNSGAASNIQNPWVHRQILQSGKCFYLYRAIKGSGCGKPSNDLKKFSRKSLINPPVPFPMRWWWYSIWPAYWALPSPVMHPVLKISDIFPSPGQNELHDRSCSYPV